MLGDASKVVNTGELMVSVVAKLGDVGIWPGRNVGGDGVLGVLLVSVMNELLSR